MRGHLRTVRHINRNLRRGVRRSVARRGNLFGLVGMVALGYALYDKYQREQAREWGGNNGNKDEHQNSI